MKQWKKITIFITVLISAVGIVFILYTGNDGETEKQEQAITEEQEKAVLEETVDYIEEDTANEEDKTSSVIVGTWKNIPDPEKEWMTSYRTCFSPDRRVAHYGGRNVDIGTWVQEGDVYTAHFDDCSYIGVDGEKYELPSYTVTYRMWFSEDEQEVILDRNTDRQAEVQLELKTEQGSKKYTATDIDDYRCPLYYESDLSEVDDYDLEYWPKIAECSNLISQELLKIAGILLEEGKPETVLTALPCTIAKIVTFDFTGDGRDEILVYVEPFERFFSYEDGAVYIISPVEEDNYTILAENTDFKRGRTDILAPDGTELLSAMTYGGASSWHGGIRYHLGYQEGQIVVDKEESYNFHWEDPIINRVNDFKNEIYYVYIARNPNEEYYPWYIDIEDSIKIDEEHFEPVYLPFSGYEPRSNDYPAVYSSFHPFSEDWWQWGGKYPEDVEDYGIGIADWIEEAKNDDPDEMLREAVEQSGYQMTKVAYPWTEETKENVVEVLRCPVADYYYISDDYAAYYARGEIYFDEIKD